MKKSIYYFYLTAIIASAMMAMTGCEPQGFEPENDGKVASIAVKEAVYVSATTSMQISLKDNEELQLNVVILPQNAKNQKVTFTNLHPELMEVTETGLLKPKTVGKDTLTVSATDGSGVSTRFVVNITDHMIKATAINVTAAGRDMKLKIGGNTFDLAACVTLTPADTWNKAVIYTSTDVLIAAVSEAGIVSPVSIGSTVITIRTTDGSNLSMDCAVTVQDLVKKDVDIDRTHWTVTTQTGTGYSYVPDGWLAAESKFTTGEAVHLFDDNAGTYLSLIKPGKSYSPGNGADPIPVQPDDFLPSFTVDMQSAQTFEYIKWRHRTGANPAGGSNNYNYLRVYGVDIEGSNDGTNFTQINTGGIVWIPNAAGYAGSASAADANTYTIEIPESTYRYVRVKLAMWSDSYNSQHPDYPGTGAASGSSMQIGEFGLGKIVIE
jgi:hypothetical protein